MTTQRATSSQLQPRLQLQLKVSLAQVQQVLQAHQLLVEVQTAQLPAVQQQPQQLPVVQQQPQQQPLPVQDQAAAQVAQLRLHL